MQNLTVERQPVIRSLPLVRRRRWSRRKLAQNLAVAGAIGFFLGVLFFGRW